MTKDETDRATLPVETISSFVFPALLPTTGEAAIDRASRSNAPEIFPSVAEEQPIVDSMRGKSSIEILDHVLSLRPAIQIPKEIWEVSEELVSRCENPGMTDDRLALLLRAVLFLDRRLYRHLTS